MNLSVIFEQNRKFFVSVFGESHPSILQRSLFIIIKALGLVILTCILFPVSAQEQDDSTVIYEA
ncbi:MAG: hypothetical protein VYA99_07630, partial [Pseudomonadota bacterium]|nr:hypothetical protein [Pseudomonadota bacterium]